MPLIRSDDRACSEQSFKCNKCKDLVLVSQSYLQCDHCDSKFHLNCKGIKGINISRVDQEKVWYCKDCQIAKPLTASPAVTTTPINKNLPEDSVHDTFERRFNKLDEHYESINLSQEILLKKIDKFDDILKLLDTTLKENNNLKQRINILESKLDQIEQAKLDTNLLVFGLPATDDDPIKTFKAISTQIQSTATTDEIQNIFYFKNKHARTSSSSQNASQSSPSNNPPLFIQFKSNKARDEFLEKKTTHKQLFLKQLGFSVLKDSQIFIREQLTLYRRKLYKSAQSLRTSHNFQYIWINRGRILVKKQNLSRVHEVRSETDIKNIGESYAIIQHNDSSSSTGI